MGWDGKYKRRGRMASGRNSHFSLPSQSPVSALFPLSWNLCKTRFFFTVSSLSLSYLSLSIAPPISIALYLSGRLWVLHPPDHISQNRDQSTVILRIDPLSLSLAWLAYSFIFCVAHLSLSLSSPLSCLSLTRSLSLRVLVCKCRWNSTVQRRMGR